MAEHAVIASYRLSGDEFGSSGEWEGIFRLEDLLAAALFAVMARFLREHPLRPASVTLRYGEPSDPQVRTAHVER
jgi:hypothetical protein